MKNILVILLIILISSGFFAIVSLYSVNKKLSRELDDELQNSKEIAGQLNELRASIAGGWKVEL